MSSAPESMEPEPGPEDPAANEAQALIAEQAQKQQKAMSSAKAKRAAKKAAKVGALTPTKGPGPEPGAEPEPETAAEQGEVGGADAAADVDGPKEDLAAEAKRIKAEVEKKKKDAASAQAKDIKAQVEQKKAEKAVAEAAAKAETEAKTQAEKAAKQAAAVEAKQLAKEGAKAKAQKTSGAAKNEAQTDSVTTPEPEPEPEPETATDKSQTGQAPQTASEKQASVPEPAPSSGQSAPELEAAPVSTPQPEPEPASKAEKKQQAKRAKEEAKRAKEEEKAREKATKAAEKEWAKEQKRLAKLWSKVDADSSGTLDASEVREVLAAMGQSDLSEEAFAAAMAEIDTDGAGEVSRDEFAAWWKLQDPDRKRLLAPAAADADADGDEPESAPTAADAVASAQGGGGGQHGVELEPEGEVFVFGTSDAKERELRSAARTDDVAAAQALLSGGAAVDAADGSGFTPLHFACCHGSLRAARLLLANGAALELPDSRGMTALHWAVTQRRDALAQLLLGHGAAIDTTGGRQQLTPFLLAAKNADWACAAPLVRLRCDTTAQSRHGEGAEALAMASSCGDGESFVARLRLLQADLATDDLHGRPAVSRSAFLPGVSGAASTAGPEQAADEGGGDDSPAAGSRLALAVAGAGAAAGVSGGDTDGSRQLPASATAEKKIPVLLSYRADEPVAATLAATLSEVLGSWGYMTLQSSRTPIEYAAGATGSHGQGGAALALEAAAAVRGSEGGLALLLVSDGYGATADEINSASAGASLTGSARAKRQALAHASLSRLECALARKHGLPMLAVAPLRPRVDIRQAQSVSAISGTEAGGVEKERARQAQSVTAIASRLRPTLQGLPLVGLRVDATDDELEAMLRPAIERALALAPLSTMAAEGERDGGAAAAATTAVSGRSGTPPLTTMETTESGRDNAGGESVPASAATVGRESEDAADIKQLPAPLPPSEADMSSEAVVASRRALQSAKSAAWRSEERLIAATATDSAGAGTGGGVRLRHPELLLEQLRHQAHELQRLLDRVYLVEQAGHAAEAERAAAQEALRSVQAEVARVGRAQEGQRAINALRSEQASKYQLVHTQLEASLQATATRVEAVGDLYAAAMAALQEERQTREKERRAWWEKGGLSAAAGGGSPTQLTLAEYQRMQDDGTLAEIAAADELTERRAADATGTDTPERVANAPTDYSDATAAEEGSERAERPVQQQQQQQQQQQEEPTIRWEVDGGARGILSYPSSFGAKLSAAYLRRQRVVELAPPPAASLWSGGRGNAQSPPGSAAMPNDHLHGTKQQQQQQVEEVEDDEAALSPATKEDWGDWLARFGGLPVRVDLCAMKQSGGRSGGMLSVYGVWAGVIVRALDAPLVELTAERSRAAGAQTALEELAAEERAVTRTSLAQLQSEAPEAMSARLEQQRAMILGVASTTADTPEAAADDDDGDDNGMVGVGADDASDDVGDGGGLAMGRASRGGSDGGGRLRFTNRRVGKLETRVATLTEELQRERALGLMRSELGEAERFSLRQELRSAREQSAALETTLSRAMNALASLDERMQTAEARSREDQRRAETLADRVRDLEQQKVAAAKPGEERAAIQARKKAGMHALNAHDHVAAVALFRSAMQLATDAQAALERAPRKPGRGPSRLNLAAAEAAALSKSSAGDHYAAISELKRWLSEAEIRLAEETGRLKHLGKRGGVASGRPSSWYETGDWTDN